MSKQLYEEAIADLKKVKEIAEDNAKRAVVEAVAPRIRELIEKELLGESLDSETDDDLDDESVEKPGTIIKEPESETSLDELAVDADASAKAEGYLDESIKNLTSSSKPENLREVDQKLRYVEKMIETLTNVTVDDVGSKDFNSNLSHLGDMTASIYDYIQERIEDPTTRLGYGLKIRKCLEKLEKLQETKMKRNLLGEEKVRIELDLPGVELGDALEDASVDLVLDEEEDESSEGEEALESPESEPEGEEAPAGEEDADDEGLLEVSDSTVVEIDENMLRREIAFMKLLREADESESAPSTDGEAPGADEFDDFGGAEEEGEALELDLSESWDLEEETMMKDESNPAGHDETSASAAHTPDKKKSGHDEDDELLELDDQDLDEEYSDDLDEMNAAMDQSHDPREKGGNVAGPQHPGADPNDQLRTTESVRSQMAKELKLQESLRKRASELKKLYESYKTAASRSKTLVERKEATSRGEKLKATYAETAERYNRSVARFNKLSGSLTEGTRKNSTRSNNVANSGASTDNKLSKKLAETNLLNAKLLFTNKLLQTESLTARQKAQVIEQLDAAETIREAKLVYESLSKALVKPRKTVTEGRILGSSSQATRPASTQTLNEGVEAERWAKLAGITK